MPFGQELALGSWDEDKDQLTRLELPYLSFSVVDLGLSLLCLLHMFLHKGPYFTHPLLHLVNILYDRAVGRWLLLPGFFSQIQPGELLEWKT